MSKKIELLETGGAALRVDLSGGKVTVFHGVDETELLAPRAVPSGWWEELFDFLAGKQSPEQLASLKPAAVKLVGKRIAELERQKKDLRAALSDVEKYVLNVRCFSAMEQQNQTAALRIIAAARGGK